MTEYYKHGFCLSEKQIRKLDTAAMKNEAVSIKISKKNLNGNMNLPLTKAQETRVLKAQNGLTLKFSRKQLKEMQKRGGFLPLLALLPALGGIAGGVGGLAGGIASAVNSSKQTAEQARHNRELEAIAKGSGIVRGKELSTTLKKFGGCGDLIGLKVGNGLYLEPYGSGLHLGPPRYY